MTTATRSPMQRLLGAHLACVGAATGAVWGALGVCLADDGAARAALSGAAHGWGVPGGTVAPAGGAATQNALLMLLLASVPLGSLLGAPVLDLVSHVVGRRPAVLASGFLVALGAIAGALPGAWTGAAAGAVAGLGVGGYAIVVPKLAHELSVRGHRRLVPRVRALAPAGAGLALVVGAGGGAAMPGQARACAWMVAAALALAGCVLAISLPETPHWYAARGGLEAAYASLRRMHGALEASVAIDWVRLDAGMQGEQHPLAVDDLRIAQVRRTVLAGLVLEAVQALPLGLAALCLTPWALGEAGGRALPVWPAVVVGPLWAALAVAGACRRSERYPLAWVLGGTGASACAVVLLVLLGGLRGGEALAVLVVVAVLLVGGQYVAVVPACTGSIDPMVPPWLLRSQRRAGAAIRPLVQIVSVLGPTALLLVSAGVAVAVVLTCQVAAMLLALLALPRALAALR
ncbi:MFS transporter [Actinomyces israelii]|uniref:MFS transporter n=1 Tax=Actinomyces israelii TaxID=1659 RepID=A0ABT4I865_9ACTO|nr:MFS transporter [Actinomyces israelii]MCZ0857298.1 MFS transporter [Actinomyces israelii]